MPRTSRPKYTAQEAETKAAEASPEAPKTTTETAQVKPKPKGFFAKDYKN